MDVDQAACLVLHHPDDAETLAQDTAELLPGDGREAAGGGVVGGCEVVAVARLVQREAEARVAVAVPPTAATGPDLAPLAAAAPLGVTGPKTFAPGAVRVTKVAASGRPVSGSVSPARMRARASAAYRAEQDEHWEASRLPQRRSTVLRPSLSPVEASNSVPASWTGRAQGPWVLV
jgi:hypothetical protein